MNFGYNYTDLPEIQRVIAKYIPGGLLLSCGHATYFANPENFIIGKLFGFHDCSFDTVKIKIIEKPEINVSYPLMVLGHEIAYTDWSNS